MRRTGAGMALLTLVLGCGPGKAPAAAITPISTEDARDLMVAWSPDGSMVAFYRAAPNGGELWVAEAGFTNPRSLGVIAAMIQSPIWSPDGRELLIPAVTAAITDIALINVADGAMTVLVATPGVDIPVQFHADGDRIVFMSSANDASFGAYTVSRSSREVVPIVVEPGAVIGGLVSPDGSHLAYFRVHNGLQDIWVAALDGGERKRLTTEGLENIELTGEQVWSPDGREFLFTSNRTGRLDIFVGNIDGSVRQLTNDINSDLDPTFSPDGKWVAFVSDRGRQADIWVMPIAGGEAIRVTDDPVQETQVRWTSNSTLSFQAVRSPGSLWTRRLSDSSETRLIADSISPEAFALSPDRSRLAMHLDLPGNNSDLVVMDMATGAMRIVSRRAVHQGFFWNPGGTHLAYTADLAGSFDVYLASATSDSSPVRLLDWPSYETVSGWTADGRSVAFTSDREASYGDLWTMQVNDTTPTRLSRIGSIVNATSFGYHGRDRYFVTLVDTTSGSPVLGELLPGGSVRSAYAAFGAVQEQSPDQELLAVVTTVDGRNESFIARADLSKVRDLEPGALPLSFSRDGKRLLYAVMVQGAFDLGIVDLASGTSTRITNTPEDESDAEFLGDSSIVLLRVSNTRQTLRADLAAVLKPSR